MVEIRRQGRTLGKNKGAKPHECYTIAPSAPKMPKKIVVNRCFGGFNLSETAKNMYNQATAGIPRPEHWHMITDVDRDDPFLVQIVENMGVEAASGDFSKLAIVEIPDDVPADGWIIQEYDGVEWVAEKHRTWPLEST